MNVYSLYNKETGLFTGRMIGATTKEDIEAMTPSDCHALLGQFDRLTQKVNLETGEVSQHEAAIDEEQVRAEEDRITRSRLYAVEQKALRYLMDKEVGLLDDEGSRRLAALSAQRLELRKKLKR